MKNCIFMFSRIIQQVVVMFSASWCGPCRAIAPKFYNCALKYESLVFVSVDVDELAVSANLTCIWII